MLCCVVCLCCVVLCCLFVLFVLCCVVFVLCCLFCLTSIKFTSFFRYVLYRTYHVNLSLFNLVSTQNTIKKAREKKPKSYQIHELLIVRARSTNRQIEIFFDGLRLLMVVVGTIKSMGILGASIISNQI